MFFHIFFYYSKTIHEILGLVFVAAVVFHVIFNWKSMKRYFCKKVFLGSFVVISLVVAGFLADVESDGENPKRVVFESLFNAPIADSVKIFKKDFVATKIVLESKGVIIDPTTTIKDVANKMETSPFAVIQIITKE